MKIVCMIPARLQSTRLPRKLLLSTTGRPLLQYVWETARRCPEFSDVVVATDSEEIAEVVRDFGGRAEITGHHHSGTDRIAEVVRRCFPMPMPLSTCRAMNPNWTRQSCPHSSANWNTPAPKWLPSPAPYSLPQSSETRPASNLSPTHSDMPCTSVAHKSPSLAIQPRSISSGMANRLRSCCTSDSTDTVVTSC